MNKCVHDFINILNSEYMHKWRIKFLNEPWKRWIDGITKTFQMNNFFWNVCVDESMNMLLLEFINQSLNQCVNKLIAADFICRRGVVNLMYHPVSPRFSPLIFFAHRDGYSRSSLISRSLLDGNYIRRGLELDCSFIYWRSTSWCFGNRGSRTIRMR